MNCRLIRLTIWEAPTIQLEAYPVPVSPFSMMAVCGRFAFRSSSNAKGP